MIAGVNSLYFTTGEFRNRPLAQKEDSDYGKILKIDFKSMKSKIISIGHRNPQGLYFSKKNNFIISTEHGPKGGDEINLNKLDKIYNFGWPVASYGVLYSGENPFVNNHKDFNFEEPKRYYVPSIAIGQIIEKNNVQKEFLFTSLRSASVYHIKFDENYDDILFEKKYLFGERIRDILKINNDYFAVTLDSSPSIGLFYLKWEYQNYQIGTFGAVRETRTLMG